MNEDDKMLRTEFLRIVAQPLSELTPIQRVKLIRFAALGKLIEIKNNTMLDGMLAPTIRTFNADLNRALHNNAVTADTMVICNNLMQAIFENDKNALKSSFVTYFEKNPDRLI